MFFLRAHGKTPLTLLIVCLIWCVIGVISISGNAILIEGQEPPRSPIASPRTIVLPQKMTAGDPATLGVLDATGRMTAGVVVELSTGQKVTTDATGRALFVAPSEPGAMTAKISGQETTAISTVMLRTVNSADSGVVGSPIQTSDSGAVEPDSDHTSILYPHFLTLHDQFTIQGAGFNGRADMNHVLLAGQPCLVVASSPISMVVLPGLHIPIGPATLRVRANGRELGPFSATTVSLEFVAPAEPLTAGSESKLVLRARGTTEHLAVEVRNSSPEVIQFLHGNVQRVRTSGGEQNIAPVDMKLLAAGNYSVTAKLISMESAAPNLDVVRLKLLDARKVAYGTWTARVDHVIAEISEPPQDIAQIRADLKQILDDKPTGQLASLLDSAWREFNP